eukprot:870358-Pleurochrysis_carterae.AAC.4
MLSSALPARVAAAVAVSGESTAARHAPRGDARLEAEAGRAFYLSRARLAPPRGLMLILVSRRAPVTIMEDNKALLLRYATVTPTPGRT